MRELIVFSGVCLVLAMVPGPGAMVVLRQAVQHHRGAALLTILGNEVALVLWGIAAATGLSALIKASELAYEVMRFAGAAVLVYLGIRALIEARRPAATGAPAVSAVAGVPAGSAAPIRGGRWKPFLLGLTANLTNPKAAVFALSFLPQFVRPGEPAFVTMVLLSVVWAIVDACWFVTVVFLVDRAKAYLSRAAVWRRLSQASGVVLIGMGLRVTLEGR